ncbi:hypothetical protein SteCoe_5005 [Stentor coeruleus]|uniref:Major facilitator superfamily (MFS) profile domain-containing protein n=1 Tax=Stentor coeruleus TaxID=5963 RepID=A0A1R2CTA3_9CILI|nr:hypothetical protein SteCoe_5005 [Stentor coeruleus]
MSKTPLPLKVCISFVGISLCEVTIMTLINPILPFMIEFYIKDSYNNVVPEDIISNNSGYLEGIYRLMQFFSSIWMSAFSDKVGRKLIIMTSLFMNLITSLALGLCTSFEAAIIIRIISGLFAGSLPVSKSFIREITDDTNISSLYGYFALGVGLASSIGPFLSTLSKPADTIGSIFDCEFFKSYPYFLPFSFNSFICLIVLILVYYCIPQTKSKIIQRQSIKVLFSNKMYLSTVGIYGINASIQFAHILVFSLICKSAENVGGIGIESEDKVSIIQGFAGIFVIFLPTLLVPVINMKIGLIRSLICVETAFIPLFMTIFACRNLFGIWKYASLAVFYGINNSCISIFILYLSICISNTVTSDILGAANGLSQAFISICRFISTSTFGIIYGWSVTSGIAFPFIDASFSYILLIILAICNLTIIITTLDPSVEHKKSIPAEIPLLEPSKI